MENVKTFKDLTKGTVINFHRSTTADDINFVVLEQFGDRFGKFTKVLRLDNYEMDMFSQHTEIINFWSIVKEN